MWPRESVSSRHGGPRAHARRTRAPAGDPRWAFEPATDAATRDALARFDTDQLVIETPGGLALTALGRRRLADLETVMSADDRLLVETLRAGIAETLATYPYLFERADAIAALEPMMLAALAANPAAAHSIARGLFWLPIEDRIRVTVAFEAHPDPEVFAALLHAWAPHRYDRPGANRSHALLPHAPWLALLRRGLATDSPAVRLDALRLIFASAVGDDMLEDTRSPGSRPRCGRGRFKLSQLSLRQLLGLRRVVLGTV